MEPHLERVFGFICRASQIAADSDMGLDKYTPYYGGGMADPTVMGRGWDATWKSPSTQEIDDLADLGLLGTEWQSDKGRLFWLTPEGRSRGGVVIP